MDTHSHIIESVQEEAVGRGDRVADGSGLENRRLVLRDHGFESHPLRFYILH